MLDDSLTSLVDLARHPENIELLLMFDDDDDVSFTWFQENIQSKIEDVGATFTCWKTSRLGYENLHQYVNWLASKAKGRWLMFWNDDAKMLTKNWDDHIRNVTAFRVLRMPTHNEHPYAIFPIVPAEWYEIFGYLSLHQLSDAWISQIAYMTDIVENIPVEVLHDRHDLTGNNKDDTFEERVILEGKPSDPRDFNHITNRQRRMSDAQKLSKVLESQGYDMSWFNDVLSGKQDPWAKMTGPEYDPNRQLMVWKR